MLIPQVATIRIFQNLDHENLEATPRTLIIRVVDKADHGIALNQVHEQGRYAFLLLSKVFLIYAGEINPNSQSLHADVWVKVQELAECADHTIVLRICGIVRGIILSGRPTVRSDPPVRQEYDEQFIVITIRFDVEPIGEPIAGPWDFAES